MACPDVVAGLATLRYSVTQDRDDTAMNVTCERSDGILWLRVSGRINILNAEQFDEDIKDAIGDCDRPVILDLENLDYISSAGLYVVLKIAKITRQRETAFALCGLSDVVHLIFERVGFDRIMAIHPTRAAALASLERRTDGP